MPNTIPADGGAMSVASLTRRLFLRNAAAGAAVAVTVAAPAAAEAVDPLSAAERVAEAVRELEAAMSAYMVGKDGRYHVLLVQHSGGRVVRQACRFDGPEGHDIIDRHGNAVAEGGAA